MTEPPKFSQRELFALYNLRHPVLARVRDAMVQIIVFHTNEMFASGEIKEIFESCGSQGLMVNGSTTIPEHVRLFGDLDISVMHDIKAEYSLSGATAAMSSYVNRVAQLIGKDGDVHAVEMDEKDPVYSSRWRGIAQKYGYHRYYVLQTLSPADIERLKAGKDITAGQIEEVCRLTGEACPQAIQSDGSFTYVTLVDAGVNSPQHFYLPTNIAGNLDSTPQSRRSGIKFATELLYLSPMEEGVRKFLALLDPSRNLTPAAFAKDVFDALMRYATFSPSAYDETSGMSGPAYNVTSAQRDLLFLTLPLQSWFGHGQMEPHFKRLDPNFRANVTRLMKGYGQLVESGQIGQDVDLLGGGKTKRVSLDSEEVAEKFLGVIWRMCQVYFGVERVGNDYNSTRVGEAVKDFWKAAVEIGNFRSPIVKVHHVHEISAGRERGSLVVRRKILSLAEKAKAALCAQYSGDSAESLTTSIAITTAVTRNSGLGIKNIRQ